MPKGSDFSAILPEQVGNFTRIAYHAPEPDQDGEATYASKKDTVTMFFSLQPSAQDVAEVMRTIQTELRHEKTDKPPRVSLETDPAYLLMVGKTIAFFAWSRGNYIFSADSQGGNSAVLERFMEAFPY